MKILNKYVIVRSNKAGVYFGKLIKKEGNELFLEDVRKLYYWSGANTVEDIAAKGVKNPKSCKFTLPRNLIVLNGFNQILPCDEEAVINLKNVEIWTY